jgi:hypothetical protein
MNRARYALAAKHRPDTFRIRRREDNFMGVFKNIRRGAAVTVCGVAMSIGLATAAQASTASIGLATAAQASTAPAATAANPTNQTGRVHSCTTNGFAGVYSHDGGLHWYYSGTGGPGTHHQVGVVRSYTTGQHANVVTEDGGDVWSYLPNSGPALCSVP